MRIGLDEAKPYFAHKSEYRNGVTEQDLPDWFVYLAQDGVCLAFHPTFWPRVWQVHVGAKREAWGKTEGPTRALLRAFWAEVSPAHVVTWIDQRNRLAARLARAVGGRIEGRMACGVECYGWRPEWLQ